MAVPYSSCAIFMDDWEGLGISQEFLQKKSIANIYICLYLSFKTLKCPKKMSKLRGGLLVCDQVG